MTHQDFTPERIKTFWSHIDRSGGQDACWPWTGYRHPSGYGQFAFSGIKWRAHRAAYLITYGINPEELYVLHKCDNPACCNPRHLFLGTALDNSHDAMEKGRRPKGSGHGMARLSDDDVIQMREDAERGVPYVEIARKFGIARQHARRICIGMNWKHV